MSESPDNVLEAMNWNFQPLKEKITTFNLDKEDAITECCAYLTQKYQKEEKSIEIGLGELARPTNKKMRFFNSSETHTYVRLRHSTRRGRIEDQDLIPVTFILKDADVDRITVKVRSSMSKLTAIKCCDGHATKFKTKVITGRLCVKNIDLPMLHD